MTTFMKKMCTKNKLPAHVTIVHFSVLLTFSAKCSTLQGCGVQTTWPTQTLGVSWGTDVVIYGLIVNLLIICQKYANFTYNAILEAELLMLIVVMCQWPSLFMLFHAFFQPSSYFELFHPPPPLVYAQCLVRIHTHLVSPVCLHAASTWSEKNGYRSLVVTPCFNACFSMPQTMLGVGVGLKVDNNLSHCDVTNKIWVTSIRNLTEK